MSTILIFSFGPPHSTFNTEDVYNAQDQDMPHSHLELDS